MVFFQKNLKKAFTYLVEMFYSFSFLITVHIHNILLKKTFSFAQNKVTLLSID